MTHWIYLDNVLKDLTRLQPILIKTDPGVGPRHFSPKIPRVSIMYSWLWEPPPCSMWSAPPPPQTSSQTSSPNTLIPFSLLYCHKHPCGSSNMPSMLQMWGLSSACNTVLYILSWPILIALSGFLIRPSQTTSYKITNIFFPLAPHIPCLLIPASFFSIAPPIIWLMYLFHVSLLVLEWVYLHRLSVWFSVRVPALKNTPSTK